MDRTLVVAAFAAAVTLSGCLVAVDPDEAAVADAGSSQGDGSTATPDPAGPGLDAGAGAADATPLRTQTDAGTCEGPCAVGEYVCARGCCPFKVATLRSSVSGGIGGFSFAVDSFGAPHVAYCNSGSNKVFYLRRSASSTFEHPVASVSGYCTGTDIEVDAAGAAHIAYSDTVLKKLYVADLQTDGSFAVREVASAGGALSVDLAFDSAGTLHLAFASSQSDTNRSGYGTRTNGVWTFEALPVADAFALTLTMVGTEPWIAARHSKGVSVIRRDSNGQLAVVHTAPELYDNGLAVDGQRAHLLACSQASGSAIRNLRHVVVEGGAATGENTGSSDTGMMTSGAMLPDGALAATHLDKRLAQVRYSVRNATGWTHMCVADGVPIERSLKLDPWGGPVIGFHGLGTPSFQIATYE